MGPFKGRRMNCLEFLEESYFVNRSLKQHTVRNYVTRAKAFQNWHGRDVLVEEFSEDLFNKYLMHLEVKCSSHTVRGARTALTTWWRDAFKRGLCKQEPVRLRLVRLEDTPKHFWTADEIKRLIAATHSKGGCFRGTNINRQLYLESLIRAAWDSALRRGDLRSIRCGAISGHGQITICQSKTGKNVAVQFTASTMDCIRSFESSDREFIWPVWSNEDRGFYITWRDIVKFAGLEGPFKSFLRV